MQKPRTVRRASLLNSDVLFQIGQSATEDITEAEEVSTPTSSMGLMVSPDGHPLIGDDGTISVGAGFAPPPDKDYMQVSVTIKEVKRLMAELFSFGMCLSLSV